MATSLDRLSDETFDLLCSVCKRKHINKEADKYCVDCSDYYCSICVKFHEDIPALSGHKILDKGQFQHGTSKELPMVPTERCDKHNHKPVDMYCQNHDDVGCSTCMAVEHRLCKDIFYIPEYIQNTNIPAPKDVLKALEATEDKVTRHLRKFQREKERISNNRTEIFEKIEKIAEEIKQRVDKLKQDTMKKSADMFEPMENMTDQNISVLQSMKSSISSAKEKVSSSGINISQVFVSTKKGQNEASKVRERADECNASYQTVDIEFEKDQILSKLLNEMTTLGKVTQRDVRKIQPTPDSEKLQKDSKTLFQIKNKNKYNVKVSSDRGPCYIFSACALEDGTVVLADHINQKLKHVESSNYIVTDSCDLSDFPRQVCVINNQEVAVSCDTAGVKCVSLQPKMTVTRQIKPGHRCFGLAHVDGHLYISDIESVYEYTTTGTKLHQFTKNQSGQPLFDNIYSIAVSGDGGKIYIADRNYGLISMDRTGKVLGTFNGPEVSSPEDALVTDNGSVLVCGYSSKNIVQFEPDCEMVGDVLKSNSNEKSYTSICFNSFSSKLIVGRYRTDEIEVYELI
ncbi:E3 ubiquitin-protein ligase Midline-1-like [Mercenaria mercenaria]|uniref:E3 ubiquitin-protein ligase Midline-1-like n=1 Tax=Mercenaria mercenaria TaxID=6596 RepID=UPI00234E39FC|nr:E3 ubiquitin-protein ligase Midline-1-like [Mercenaria mercenaria]